LCTHLPSHVSHGHTIYIYVYIHVHFQGSHLGHIQPRTFHLGQGFCCSAVLPLTCTLLTTYLWEQGKRKSGIWQWSATVARLSQQATALTETRVKTRPSQRTAILHLF